MSKKGEAVNKYWHYCKAVVLLCTFLFSISSHSQSLEFYNIEHPEIKSPVTLIAIGNDSYFRSSPEVGYFSQSIIQGAQKWYLNLHKEKGSFTEGSDMLKAFNHDGPERFDDGRSNFVALARGTQADILEKTMWYGYLPESEFLGLLRFSTASHKAVSYTHLTLPTICSV